MVVKLEGPTDPELLGSDFGDALECIWELELVVGWLDDTVMLVACIVLVLEVEEGIITMLSTDDVLEDSACSVKFENGTLLARLFLVSRY